MKEGRNTILGGVFANRRCSFALRMAPMIDIIFLLLIFFLVTSQWRQAESFLPFRLPAAQAAEHYSLAGVEPLMVHITAEDTGCQVQFGLNYRVSLEDETIERGIVTLADQFKKCLLQQRRFATDPIEISCGPDVKWDHLAKIYNMFYAAGLTDITFLTTE